MVIKAFRTVLPFLFFTGLTHAYLVKTSLTHNKYLTFLLLENNDPISAKPAAQILSLNLTYTFLLLDFLVTGLCNSLANCSFTLTPDPDFKKLIDHTCYCFLISISYDFWQLHKLCLSKSYLK